MMLFDKSDRILFLGCHLDDIEYGCGGLVCHLANNGYIIHLHTLSCSNKDSKGVIQLERDISEATVAMNRLNIKVNQFSIGECFGQIFDMSNQQIREELISLKQQFQPSVVFFPCINDIHQDHHTLAENSFRIFRDVTCYGYEIIRSSFQFIPHYFQEISSIELDKKIKAIMSYKSQLDQSAGYYFNSNLIESIARFRGGQCGLTYAEAFECYRMIARI